MEERLREGFTLIMSGEYEGISGGYLKRGNNGIGMIPACLVGDEEKVLEAFPKILETIRSSKILQLYSSGNDVVGMIGSRHYEGPYAEKEYLEVLNGVQDNSVIGVLTELDLQLSKSDKKENVKTYRKAYKLYGSDKYKLEEVRNEK